MTFEKLLLRHQTIDACLKSVEGRDGSALLTQLGRPFRDFVAAQERLLCAAEALADRLRLQQG